VPEKKAMKESKIDGWQGSFGSISRSISEESLELKSQLASKVIKSNGGEKNNS